MTLKAFYNLPQKVEFCSKCVNSNQYPTSIPEFDHKADRKNAKYISFDKEKICDGCKQNEIKKKINYKLREKELLKLLEKYRKNNGEYDCLVPGSGGKDSVFASHILKNKYGMKPLTCTWPPILYTEYGYKNFKNWLEIGGFDNLSFNQNPKVLKILTKLCIENLLHPFQTFILGQKNFPPKLAKQLGIDLIFYGENEAEYGNPISDNSSSLRNKSYYTTKNLDNVYLAGEPIKKIIEKYNLNLADLAPYLPLPDNEFEERNIQIHYLGYYIKWIPQEVYYYAVENTNFKARPFRSQGTYSKYNSIDDKIDCLHHYTRFIKFGIGRATTDSSQEIRNNHITREEGKLLVKRFDGEFPDKYFNEVMNYINLKPDKFYEICNKFRSPHLWKNVNGQWKLRHTVNKDGEDD